MPKGYRLLGLVAVVLATLLVLYFAYQWSVVRDLREHGASLFEGRTPLVAHLRGDPDELPTVANRCSNCHRVGPTSKETLASASTRDFGPALSGDYLRLMRSRRAGPLSSYDVATFCNVLTKGIDPAQIMVNQTMPHYVLSVSQCAALWTYLTQF